MCVCVCVFTDLMFGLTDFMFGQIRTLEIQLCVTRVEHRGCTLFQSTLCTIVYALSSASTALGLAPPWHRWLV